MDQVGRIRHCRPTRLEWFLNVVLCIMLGTGRKTVCSTFENKYTTRECYPYIEAWTIPGALFACVIDIMFLKIRVSDLSGGQLRVPTANPLRQAERGRRCE